MCGVVGFVGLSDESVLVAMRDALQHRGPDGAGAYAEDGVSLGHRRLAIVDVAGGAQPAFNEDRTIAVVFNGEIYNHPELRPQLEAAGHRFGSDADTESILHAYEEYGFQCPARLRGMFAFVLHDRKRKVLFGARDRLGEKPLYYRFDPAAGVSFAFASEPKALRRHPALDGAFELDPAGLLQYLTHDYTLGETTIFSGVRRLPPGAAFTVDLSRPREPVLRTWRYWEPEFKVGKEDGERFLDLLGGAVRRMLMADVPLGLFLSGGIDSSTLAALFRRQFPGSDLATFSIGFDDPSFDESRYSEIAARHLKTRHRHRRFTAAELRETLPALAGHLDEPFADPSILPVSLLSGFAREHVTVALGGDGGDELLAGYDPFRALSAGEMFRRLVPRWLHGAMTATTRRLVPATDANLSLGFKLARFLRGAA
ncbi:MAG TPA: asparagine synthase (glutamine-hydrolyzing), partial [Planctomycetia bacterium]|nr:asparagine synthase (glutamine-hydrolyzing) [Planctomycetia bacterium]